MRRIGRKFEIVIMHGNDNKTHERELVPPRLEHMHLVASCDLELEELLRSLMSHETNYIDGQETDRNICHFVSANNLRSEPLLWQGAFGKGQGVTRAIRNAQTIR